MRKEQLPELIDRYLSGKATPLEQALLDDVFSDFQQHQDLHHLSDEAKSELENKMLQQMHRLKNGTETKKLNKSHYFPFWTVAASITLLLAIAALFYNPFQHRTTPGLQKAIAKSNPPTTATLRLANGATVNLKPGANGILAIQGDVTVKKTKDGQLLYEGATDQESAGNNYNTLNTPKGVQFQLTLADGTKVWLNAKSSLTYPTVFNKNQRVVSLKGEAYFEVAKIYAKTNRGTARMPFIVKTENAEVEVLGTHFNLMAYSDAPFQETTLLEGAVNVKHANQVQKIIPGQQASFSNKHNTQINVSKVNLEAVMSWKSGLFFFEDTKLEEVMNQLSRWYGVTVVYGNKIPDVEFTGVLPRNQDVASILNFLQGTQEVKFSLSGNKIIVENK